MNKHIAKDEEITENCNPIDLSIIIKTNLMKSNDIWTNKTFLQKEPIFEEQDNDFVIHKNLLNSTVMNQITNQANKDKKPDVNQANGEERVEEEMDTSLAQNFHDENCNIKVE